MWFVPFLAVTLVIFFGISYICNKNSYLSKFNDVPLIVIALVFGFIGGGLVLSYGIGKYYLFVAMLMQPVILMGYMGKKYSCFNSLISSKLLLVPSFIVMFLLVKFSTKQIELSKGEILGNPLLFYIITFIGIIFCFSLSSIIANGKTLSNLMQYIGKMSFYLMAFQFIAIKLIDAIYGITNESSREVLVKFPYSFVQLRPLYLIFAISFSLFLGWSISWVSIHLNVKKFNL